MIAGLPERFWEEKSEVPNCNNLFIPIIHRRRMVELEQLAVNERNQIGRTNGQRVPLTPVGRPTRIKLKVIDESGEVLAEAVRIRAPEGANAYVLGTPFDQQGGYCRKSIQFYEIRP